jgi:hypothetical protein
MLFARFPDEKLPVTCSHCRNPSPMRWTFWAMAAFLLADSAHAATETAIRSIDIAHDSDAYVANVVMFAPVATDVAWQVLTDFDHMAEWVPNVRESKVIAREPNAVTIEQHGVDSACSATRHRTHKWRANEVSSYRQHLDVSLQLIEEAEPSLGRSASSRYRIISLSCATAPRQSSFLSRTSRD